MNKYELMTIDELKAEIVRYTPCAHGKCYTDPRYEYARRLWCGKGIAVNKTEAFYYFKEAADFGHEGACCRVGTCYYDGEGITQDYEKALESFIRRSKVHALSQGGYLGMGKCLLKIEKRDEKVAFECFYTAAKEHRVSVVDDEVCKEAQYLLALCYYYGVGIEKNTVQAFVWFEKAGGRDNGHLGAQYYLVKCFRDSIGTKQDSRMASFWSLKCFEKEYENVVKEGLDTLGITIK